MSDANQHNTHNSLEPGKPAVTTLRWQFSIRGILVLTAIVSAVLAFAVRMPVTFQILLIVAAITLLIVAAFKSANFVTSDRRPAIATIAWSLLALFFALFALITIGVGIGLLDDRLVVIPIALSGTMAICFIVSGLRAARSFRKIFKLEGQRMEDSSTSNQN